LQSGLHPVEQYANPCQKVPVPSAGWSYNIRTSGTWKGSSTGASIHFGYGNGPNLCDATTTWTPIYATWTHATTHSANPSQQPQDILNQRIVFDSYPKQYLPKL